MDLLDEKEGKPRPNKKRNEMNGWECALSLGRSLISSGYGLALILMIGFVACVWGVFSGMESGDKKEALLAILGWLALGIAGWLCSGLTIFISSYLLRFQATAHKQQIAALTETKEAALTIQERLPLDNILNKKD